MKLFLRTGVVTVVTLFTSLAYGSPDWLNSGPDNNYNNGQNWTTPTAIGTVPGPGDSAHIFPGFVTGPTQVDISVLPGGSTTINIASNTSDAVQSLLVSSNFEGVQIPNGVLNLGFNNGSTYTIGTDGVVITGTATLGFTGNLSMPAGNFVVGTNNSTIDPGQVTGTGAFVVNNGLINLDGASSLIVAQGANGAFQQQTATSIVVAGQNTIIGDGAAGTYTMTGGATLDIGTPVTPLSATYAVQIGAAANSTGTLSLTDSNINATNPGTIISLGNAAGAIGTITQAGNSTVNLGSNTLNIGSANGGTGIYNLVAGTLNVNAPGGLVLGGTVNIGSVANAAGTFSQSGGTLQIGALNVGNGGTGTYALSGGVANLPVGMAIGGAALTGGGTVNQTGGTLNAGGIVTVGNGNATGTYAISGTAISNLNAGMFVNSNGVVNQTGGLVTVPLGQTVDLTTAGSVYNLAGGTLSIGNNGVNGIAGVAATGGMFNFGGGTLLAAPGSTGPLTIDLNSNITGTSTIDPTNANVILSGTLSGNGTLVLLNADKIAITGANSGAGSAWGAYISAGTFNTNSSNLSATGTFTIADGAHMIVTPDLPTFSGTIAGLGSATFATLGANNFVIANASLPATTTTTIGTGGSLEIDNGTISNIDATGSSVNPAVPSLVIGNGVGSTGTVNLLLNGTLPNAANFNIFPNVHVQTGSTLVTQTLSATNNIVNDGTIVAPTSVVVAAGGAITNNGSLMTPLITGSLTNTGTLAATGAVGTVVGTPTLTISGNLTSTGTLLIRTTGTNTDLFNVLGATGLAPATVSGIVKVTGSNGTGFGSGSGVYTIVKTPAAGDLVIGPAGLVQPTSSLLFSATVAPDPTGQNLILTTVQQPVANYARSRNQQVLAHAIDKFVPAPILGALNNPAVTADQISNALAELTPDNLQYSRNIAFENSTFLAQTVNGALANMRNGYGLDTSGVNIISPGFGSSLGRTMGTLLADNSHSAAPNGINYYPDDSGSPSSPGSVSSGHAISDSPIPLSSGAPARKGPQFSEFIGGDVILADLNQNQNNGAKAKYTAGDANAGIAFRITSHLSAGLMFDYNHTSATTDIYNSRTQVDTYSPGVFGTFFEKGFYVNGLFAFGLNNYINKRNIPAFGTTATSNPHGQQYVGDLDFGYDFHPAKGWTVGPTIGGTYTHLDIDPFRETGAAIAADDFTVSRQSDQSFRTRIGGHLSYATHTGSILLEPNASLMWQHEYIDQSAGFTATASDPTFGSGPLNFTSNSLNEKDSALVGCGLTATLDNSMALYVNYFADAGNSDYFAQSIIGGFKAAF